MSFLLILLVIFIDWSSSCPLTDNYLSRCHCGILTNGESYIKCDEYTLDDVPVFKRSFPYDELILKNNNIVNLTRSSFDHIRTIKRIDIGNNSLSFIDADVLRSVGNYLEELTLTADNHIDNLEFLTRYPLKKLRVLKLDHFNLAEIDLEKIFINMTKLEYLQLRSCQVTRFPNLSHIQRLDLEHNRLSDSILLTTAHVHLNLADNPIKSIVLQNNPSLIALNLSKNHLNEIVSFPKTNPKLKDLDLTENYLTFIDFSMFNEQLINLKVDSNRFLSINMNDLPKNLQSLSIRNNYLKQMKFPKKESALKSLDVSSNQLKTIEKNVLFEKLQFLNLEDNPLQCNCQLDWLYQLVQRQQHLNASSWTCQTASDSEHLPFLLADFQCTMLKTPRIVEFNISYVQISSQNGLFVRWSIVDDHKMMDFLQVSISEPFYLSMKLRSNQTQIFLTNQIQSNQLYHVCLLVFHRYARDKYCREIFTDKLIVLMSEESLDDEKNDSKQDYSYPPMNFQLMLIGSAVGGLLTFLIILTCCYLCYQLQKLKMNKDSPMSLYQHAHVPYYTTNPTIRHPIYQTHSMTCPYHQENASNSTDSSQMDASLSTTNTSNFKHIYQTIEDRDYSTLQQKLQPFDLFHKSLKNKR